MRTAFPRFFLSPTLLKGSTFDAVDTGLGLYTCANSEDMNLTEVVELYGATTNWDAHFYWPYIGMFLPPIEPPNANWKSNTGPQEEPNCGAHFSHGATVNAAVIGKELAAAAANGIKTLQYFNLIEYGQNFDCAHIPASQVPPPANDWQNATVFLANHMRDALWPGCPGTGWQGGIDLDPASPSYHAFLVSQAQHFIDTLQNHFYGIAVDRLDHLKMWNNPCPAAFDDGLAWCGAPCYPLMNAWNRVMGALSDVIHTNASGRLITANYMIPGRVDALQHVDGVFSEDFYNHIAQLLNAGLSTTGKPPNIIWTYSADEVLSYKPTSDAYMAQHVLMKAFPFAPALGNDHSIQPVADQACHWLYASCASIFRAVRGGCWWLAPEPVVTTPVLRYYSNAFTRGGGCTAPGVNGGNGPVQEVLVFLAAPEGQGTSNVMVTLADPFEGTAPSRCESTVPGVGVPWSKALVPVRDAVSGRWAFAEAFTMSRGALLIRCYR